MQNCPRYGSENHTPAHAAGSPEDDNGRVAIRDAMPLTKILTQPLVISLVSLDPEKPYSWSSTR
jgi:hypothetical protein